MASHIAACARSGSSRLTTSDHPVKDSSALNAGDFPTFVIVKWGLKAIVGYSTVPGGGQHDKIAGNDVNPQPWPLLGLHFVQLTLHNTSLSAGVMASDNNGQKTDPSSKPETGDFELPETPLASIFGIGLLILMLKFLNDTFD